MTKISEAAATLQNYLANVVVPGYDASQSEGTPDVKVPLSVIHAPSLEEELTNKSLGAGTKMTAAALVEVMFKAVPATVAATGSDQAGAAALTTGFTLVTAADGTKGVRLPTAEAGLIAVVKNRDSENAILKVYPATSDVINALSANAAISMAAKTCALFWAYDETTWYTLPLLPS